MDATSHRSNCSNQGTPKLVTNTKTNSKSSINSDKKVGKEDEDEQTEGEEIKMM